MKNVICLIVGESGSGKTTMSNLLSEYGNLNVLESYTTRPERYKDEKGHVFVTDEDYELLKPNICAFTEFDGYKYWATNDQVDKSDVYVIDPAGIDYFKNQYRGEKHVVVVYLKVDKKERKRRMLNRGDSKKAVKRRLKHDKKAFKNVEKCADVIFTSANSSMFEISTQIYGVMLGTELMYDKKDKSNGDIK